MSNRPSNEQKIFSLGDIYIDDNGFITFPLNAQEDSRYRVIFSKLEEVNLKDEEMTIEKRTNVQNGHQIKVKGNIGSANDLFLFRIKRSNGTLYRYQAGSQEFTWFRFRLCFQSSNNTFSYEVAKEENGIAFESDKLIIWKQNTKEKSWNIPVDKEHFELSSCKCGTTRIDRSPFLATIEENNSGVTVRFKIALSGEARIRFFNTKNIIYVNSIKGFGF